MSAAEIRHALAHLAEAERAKTSARFFKTGPGQYGEGDQFIGVSVPNQRLVARRFAQAPFPELATLLASPVHEERLTALLILVHQFKLASTKRKPDLTRQQTIIDFYVAHMPRINNWDLVDSSAPYIVGRYLLTHPRSARSVLQHWARSNSQWQRRVAVLSTMALIQAHQFEDILSLSEQLLDDKEDLIHKALGWMLREVGKRDIATLRGFLDRHHTAMPRIMLRYAIEKLSAKERQKYMTKPKQA